MAFRSAVITFPGSNCDRDMADGAGELPRARRRSGSGTAMPNLPERLDFIALPGGFSYGDYLRSGAMAARSPIMQAVIAAAQTRRAGAGRVQRLSGADRSGAAARRADAQCQPAFRLPRCALTVENTQSLFTAGYDAGQMIHIPVAHHDGNYFADSATLDRLEGEGRVAFRYAEAVNGSARDIAGVLNEAGNVLGMMPHPERAIEAAAWRQRWPRLVRKRSQGAGRGLICWPDAGKLRRSAACGGALAEQGERFGGFHRAAEIIALDLVAAQFADQLRLLGSSRPLRRWSTFRGSAPWPPRRG